VGAKINHGFARRGVNQAGTSPEGGWRAATSMKVKSSHSGNHGLWIDPKNTKRTMASNGDSAGASAHLI